MKEYYCMVSLRIDDTVAETYLPIKVMLDENEVDKRNISYIENKCREAYNKKEARKILEFNRVESVVDSNKFWKYMRDINVKL